MKLNILPMQNLCKTVVLLRLLSQSTSRLKHCEVLAPCKQSDNFLYYNLNIV